MSYDQDDREEKVLFRATIIYPVRDGKLLLGFKTKKIGANCWNGYGGGVEGCESAERCALRELKEECSMTGDIDKLEKIGFVYFDNQKEDGEEFCCECAFFLLHDPVGEPVESETMVNPTWFDPEELPFAKMMLGDREFLPQMLEGIDKVFRVPYGPRQKTLRGPIETLELDEIPEFSKVA